MYHNIFSITISRRCFVQIAFMLLVAIGSAFGQQSKTSFVIKGRLLKSEAKVIYLSYHINKEQRTISDSAVIHKSRFIFKGTTYEPTIASISLNRRERGTPNDAWIFLEPSNMRMIVKANRFDDLRLKGSKTQKDYQLLRKQKNVVLRKYDRQTRIFAGENLKKNQGSLKSNLNESINKIDYNYCASYPRSYLTAWLIQMHAQDLTLDSLTMFYDNLGEKLQNNILGQNIADRTLQRKSALVGTKAPGFSSIDIKQNPLTLYSFTGKYVLLDFWASWCKPCRENSRQIIELYNNYNKKGFEIIGISSDNYDTVAWKKAITKDSTGRYYHILNGMDREARSKGMYNDKDIGRKYGVGVLPTMILINPDGIIIGRYENIGRLTDKIRDIFNEL